MTELAPRLYVIMRKDIPDMNTGKAIAQASHLGNDVTMTLEGTIGQDNIIHDAYNAWLEDRTFGVALSFEMTNAEVHDLFLLAVKSNNVAIGTIHDPSYPIRAASGYCYTVPMDTCYWMFVPHMDFECVEYMNKLPLHR